MKHSSERILTTHCGSLARPKDLLDMMRARATGQPLDPEAWDARVRSAVADSVRQQADSGLDVITDGEQGKRGFFAYVNERLGGFEEKPGSRALGFEAEVNDFPEYYEQYFRVAMVGGSIAARVAVACTGPVVYQGQDAVRRDIENLKAAVAGLDPEEVFMPAVAPSGVGGNEYYRTDEEFLFAVADALHVEYQAIVDAGFILQVDDPFLTDIYSYAPQDDAGRKRTASIYVDAVNHALRGISPDRVRFHTCYGINEGPRVHDAPLAELVDEMLRVNATAYSFEAANPRHEHEYHLWERVRLPEGKILIPGVITHASNIVEHPELIAERICRYARLVGRENVIAGADCGFSSQATFTPEVHPTVVWAKFRAMAEGARLATEELWR
jgi:5-methyltetrahydropteroyltriglutamate--homocysteine methyltransferase